MAPAPRRRVSYLVPPPTEPVPVLQLPPLGAPRHGKIGPLLLHSEGSPDSHGTSTPRWTQFTRHRLGVVSLALDTSTQLVGRPAPEGILYTGGRDGLVIAWDLGIPMKARTRKYGAPSSDSMRMASGRWEMMTGWADEVIDEDVEDGEEGPRSDGDILGEVKGSGKRRRRSVAGDATAIPFEQQWETDYAAFEEGKASHFRQSTQMHSDWVNDILLANHNQTIVSASSDGSVKAWNPHANPASDPSTIGIHNDYVRCLGYCREQNYVASGSFDRTIKLWDLGQSASNAKPEPLITLNPPESSGPKSSVYAMALDPFGHTIVSGGPERVIRIWDPRAGKRVGKLVGHTDNIRAILLSEDSRYLLTASADASVKLWSLASHRCLHTFTHHTDSVWSLFSSHPSLEIFYSGDRSGFVTKVDVEGCADMSEGECVVICQDTDEVGNAEGINKMVAMDDNLVWTASGNSSLKRWRVPPRRAVRAAALTDHIEGMETLTPPESPFKSSSFGRKSRSIDTFRSRPRSVTMDNTPTLSTSPSYRPRHASSMSAAFNAADLSDQSFDPHEGNDTWYGIPFESLVRLTSPHDPFTPFSPVSRGRDTDVATLYSAASVMSVPRAPAVRSPLQSIFPQAQDTAARAPSPVHSEARHSRLDEPQHAFRSARAEFEEREVVADAVPLRSTPDEVVEGDKGLVRAVVLNDRIHVLTVDTAGEVAVWDMVRAACLGRYRCQDVAGASFRGSEGSGASCGGKDRSPREMLEIVRERIEGEAVVLPWSTVDTKVGVLTVHVDEKCFDGEVYADEAGVANDRIAEDHRINIGKWVLRNLFLGFIRAEQRASARRAHESQGNHSTGSPPHSEDATGSPNTLSRRRSSSTESSKSANSATPATVITASTMVPAMPPHVSAIVGTSPLIAPKIPLLQQLSPIVQTPEAQLSNSELTPIAAHGKSQTESAARLGSSPPVSNNDYFSVRVRGRSGSNAAAGSSTPDDFSGWSGPGAKPAEKSPEANLTVSGGGLMGRLKSLGRHKRPPSEHGPLPKGGVTGRPSNASRASNDASTPGPATKTPAQIILSGPLNPPLMPDGPTLRLVPSIPLVISEEASPSWNILYRGTVASTAADMHALEETIPMWLMEYLLLNKANTAPITKLGFVLLPWHSKEPDAEMLPELLNVNQSKLTASRFLRVRKLMGHVHDKIDKMSGKVTLSPTTPHVSPRTSSDTHNTASSRPEELWEILCNDTILAPEMTLAAVRQFVWRQSAELTMFYRRKRSAGTVTNLPINSG